MYEFGLGSDAANKSLSRTVAFIQHLELPETHEWIKHPPSPGSEVATLQASVPQEPIPIAEALRTAMMTALESLAHIRFSIQAGCYTLPGMRSMMRTALMGVGRVGFVVLPDTRRERQGNAEKVLTQEARSLSDALDDIQSITTLPGLLATDEQAADFRQQISQFDIKGRKFGDRGMIRRSAALIGSEVARVDSSISEEVLRDHLTWIWNTASGAAHAFDWQNLAPGEFVPDIADVAAAAHCVLAATGRAWKGTVDL
jgi:hypothetical protein